MDNPPILRPIMKSPRKSASDLKSALLPNVGVDSSVVATRSIEETPSPVPELSTDIECRNGSIHSNHVHDQEMDVFPHVNNLEDVYSSDHDDYADDDYDHHSSTPPMPILIEGQCDTDFTQCDERDAVQQQQPLKHEVGVNSIKVLPVAENIQSDVKAASSSPLSVSASATPPPAPTNAPNPQVNGATAGGSGNIWDRIAKGFLSNAEKAVESDYHSNIPLPGESNLSVALPSNAPITNSSHSKQPRKRTSKPTPVPSGDVYDFNENEVSQEEDRHSHSSTHSGTKAKRPRKSAATTGKKKPRKSAVKSRFPPEEVDIVVLPKAPAPTVASTPENRFLCGPFITLNDASAVTNGSSSAPKAPAGTLVQQNVGSAYRIVNPALRDPITGLEMSSALCFRPQLRPPKTQELTHHQSWKCAFCGQKSSFLRMGCLYGPYFLEEDELARIPGSFIIPKDAPEIPVTIQTSSDVKLLLKAATAGGVTAVSPGSSPSSDVKGKQRSSKTLDPLLSSDKDDWRISPKGDVWFHRLCVLYSPGTHMLGSGKIGGLADTLAMALGATCICCHRFGATLSCRTRGCSNCYHYYCAVESGCAMDCTALSILCPSHKTTFSRR